jgi:hypothetical protein
MFPFLNLSFIDLFPALQKIEDNRDLETSEMILWQKLLSENNENSKKMGLPRIDV